jgi:hypothetical protein
MAHTPYDTEWLNAKSAFEAATDKSKPREKTGLNLIKGIMTAFGNHSGLSQSLKACEKAHADCEKADKYAKDGQQKVKTFSTAAETYSKAMKNYLTVLDKEITKQAKTEWKSEYEKALKFLRKELIAIEGNINEAIGQFKVKFEKFDKNAPDVSVDEKIIATWKKKIEAALSRAAAGVAKIKMTPNAKTYNALFPAIAQDITVQLSIAASQIDGVKLPADACRENLERWAKQSQSDYAGKVKEGTSAEAILDLSKEFTGYCKEVVKLVKEID